MREIPNGASSTEQRILDDRADEVCGLFDGEEGADEIVLPWLDLDSKSSLGRDFFFVAPPIRQLPD